MNPYPTIGYSSVVSQAANPMVSQTASSARSGACSLLIRGLRKAFADVQAVDGIDLQVAPGECFGLLGPNGAGKTTTIEICEGLTEPDAGTVELLGLNWRTSAKSCGSGSASSSRRRSFLTS